ncbi:murein biosynthesis integral membrane protein MurJ [Heyndrickxia coagulans]
MKKLILLKNATFIVVILTLLSKITGFIRDQVIAFQYGATNIADTYSTVLSLPQYVSNIIGGVVLSCFVPLYISIKQNKGLKRAEKFSYNIFSFMVIFLVTLDLIFYLFSHQIGMMYFGENMTNAQLTLITIVLPIQIFLSLSMFFTAKLNANENYHSSIFSTILMNCLFILIVLLFEKSSKTLVVGTLFSAVAQLIYLILSLNSGKANFKDIFTFPNYKDIKEFLVLGIPVMIGSFSVQAYTITDKILARDLPEGNIASLSYAQKLTQLPVGIIATAVSTILLSSLSKLASSGETKKLNKELIKSINLTMIMLIPIILIIFFLAEPITKILFQRGEFDYRATIMTTKAVKAYSIGILGTSLTMVLSRVFFAKKNTITPVISNICSAGVDILLAFLLVRQYQNVGLAIAYSISVVFNTIFLLIAYMISMKKSIFFIYKKTFIYSIKYIFLTMISSAAMILISEIINPNKNFVYLILSTMSFLLIYGFLIFIFLGLKIPFYKKS